MASVGSVPREIIWSFFLNLFKAKCHQPDKTMFKDNLHYFSQLKQKFHTSCPIQDQQNAKHFRPKLFPMLPPDTFKGKTAFITGGGTGLGKGMTMMLSQLGADVAICSRKLEILTNTANEISTITGTKILPVQADIRDPEAVKTAVNKTVEELGLPDIIINNAAGNFIIPLHKLSPKGWRVIVDVVLNGAANVTMDIGKRLIAAKKGAVFLSISTIHAATGSAFVCPSASAKSGLETLTKSLAAEWGRYGIRFNCIATGPIHTKGLLDRFLPSEEYVDILAKRIPAGRLGEVPELANLAAYLVSDYSSWVNGTVIPFDGGESVYMCGEYNLFTVLNPEDWEKVEHRVGKLTRDSTTTTQF